MVRELSMVKKTTSYCTVGDLRVNCAQVIVKNNCYFAVTPEHFSLTRGQKCITDLKIYLRV